MEDENITHKQEPSLPPTLNQQPEPDPPYGVTLTSKPDTPLYPLTPCSAYVMANLVGSTGPPKNISGIDLIAVVDKSGSMMGTKLDLVKQTILFVVENLREFDFFGLVTFSNDARVDSPLVRMTLENKEVLVKAIQGIQANSSTNLSAGLLCGISQMEASTSSNQIQSIMLMADGQANLGIQEKEPLVRAVQDLFSKGTKRPTISCFGYGSDADNTLMTAMATVGEGVYYFVENNDDIAGAYGDCLGGLLSIVAQNITLKITPQNGTKIKKILGKHNIKISETDPESSIITLKDLYTEEHRNTICILELPDFPKFPEIPKIPESNQVEIVTFELEYFDIQLSRFEKKISTCVVTRVELLDQSEKGIRDYELDVHINRIKVAEAMDEARLKGERGDLEGALKVIEDAMDGIKNSVSMGDVLCTKLMIDLEEVRNDMETKASFSTVSQKLSSKVTSHMQQRSVRAQSAYSTPSQRVMSTTFQSQSTTGILRNTEALEKFAAKSQVTNINNYEILNSLGKGQFSQVFLARSKTSQELCALKIVPLTKGQEYLVLREVEIMEKLYHPHIVRMKDWFVETTNGYLVMELVRGGTLEDIIYKEVSEKNACRLIQQILSALAYLHALGITHRDIKPENILSTTNDPATTDLKLSDFGLSKNITEGTMRTACCTPYFVAPEVILAESYTEKVDIWAVGVICFILLAGHGPFLDNTDVELYSSIIAAKYDRQKLDCVSVEAKNFVLECIVVNVDQRLSAEKALNHAWFLKNKK